MLERTKKVYKEWQKLSQNFPKTFRFGLGGKIEQLFIEILELQFKASFLKPTEKEGLVKETLLKFDLLKFFFQISWENNYIKERLYIHFSKDLQIIGKELSGWKTFLQNKNSQTSFDWEK